MKMNQVEVFINAHGEILLSQVVNNHWSIVRITKDQADVIAKEIKKIAKQLKEEQNNG